jgi:hypothetical protein
VKELADQLRQDIPKFNGKGNLNEENHMNKSKSDRLGMSLGWRRQSTVYLQNLVRQTACKR